MADDTRSRISADNQAFLEKLGLPTEFVAKLLVEEDWSFVVKVHALIEAAVTHALIYRLNLPEAHKFLARLQLGAAGNGKLAFAEAVGLIPPAAKSFVRGLSEVRNMLVHDVRNVHVDLRRFFEQMPPDRMVSCARRLCYVIPDVPFAEMTNEVVAARLLSDPKGAIWDSTAFFLFGVDKRAQIELLEERNAVVQSMLAGDRGRGE